MLGVSPATGHTPSTGLGYTLASAAPTLAEDHQHIGDSHRAICNDSHDVGHQTEGNVRPFKGEHGASFRNWCCSGAESTQHQFPLIGHILDRITPLSSDASRRRGRLIPRIRHYM